MNETTFLETAIRGRYADSSEDRLTQIFVASFNSSGTFRRAVGALLSISNATTLNATSQVHDGAGRIDVVICRNAKEICRIENKIDAPLTIQQMRLYSRKRTGNVNPTRVVALVKRYPADAAVLSQFDIYRWSSLDRLLTRSELDATFTDGFVTLNFHRHLEATGMANVDHIPLASLRDLGKAIHALRTDSFPYLSLSRSNFFETATHILSMCQDLIEEARKDVELSKRIGRSFRFNPKISSTRREDGEGKKNLEELTLTASIILKKPLNNIKEIQAGIAISAKDPTKIAIGTWFLNPDNFYKDEIFAKSATLQVKGDLQADDFIRFCLKKWRKALIQRK